LRQIWLVARGVLIEAIRRKEIYAIILVSLLLIGGVMTVDFFHLEGISKFYREIALKVMSIATAITTVVLAARQLPREFENRTIYPLLAKPVSRWKFLVGKLFGVMLAAAFCLGLFMIVFVAGSLYLHAHVPWGLTLQFIYLQMMMLLILAALSFWLSLMLNLDAAITTGLLFYATSAIITSATSFIYDWVSGIGRIMLIILNYLLPQLTLFDLSAKAVHSEAWPPVSAAVIFDLTLYGLVFVILYGALAYAWFRKRPL
jgi:ABC-type transport system involved in multi-copper enzyme maturation permease subunit